MLKILNSPTCWAIYIIAFIFLLIIYINRRKVIGKAGEHWTKQELDKLDQTKYMVINDITLKSDDHTSQIDHIVVSKYGIFVIETKQINGYIKGSEYDNKWIVNKKYHVYNPIRQNYGHVKCLEEVLNLPNNYFIPIVCITSTAKFNIKAKSHVVPVYELIKTIESYKDELIKDYPLIYTQILSLKITDKRVLKEHVEYAKQVKEQSENNRCPLCGGNLVYREGKYGKFIGCSNYPRCKFTKKI